MLSIARRAFNSEPEPEIFLPAVSGSHKLNISRLSFRTDLSIGLRLILDQISHAESSPNPNNAVGLVIKKPANTFNFISDPITSVTSPNSPIRSEVQSGDFLKSCNLCKKRLCSNDDIYMYMGDQGFCSVECRSKQISTDETKELEKALKRRSMKAKAPPPSAAARDPPKCPDGGNCETCRLLEDLRQRRRRRKQTKT